MLSFRRPAKRPGLANSSGPTDEKVGPLLFLGRSRIDRISFIFPDPSKSRENRSSTHPRFPVDFAFLFTFSNDTHVVSLGIPRVRRIASPPTPVFSKKTHFFAPIISRHFSIFTSGCRASRLAFPRAPRIIFRGVCFRLSKIFVFPAFFANRRVFPKDTWGVFSAILCVCKNRSRLRGLFLGENGLFSGDLLPIRSFGEWMMFTRSHAPRGNAQHKRGLAKISVPPPKRNRPAKPAP